MLVTIIWSIKVISTVFKAFKTASVAIISFWEGLQVPPGWLWDIITDVALLSKASLTISLGYTADLLTIPLLITW